MERYPSRAHADFVLQVEGDAQQQGPVPHATHGVYCYQADHPATTHDASQRHPLPPQVVAEGAQTPVRQGATHVSHENENQHRDDRDHRYARHYNALPVEHYQQRPYDYGCYCLSDIPRGTVQRHEQATTCGIHQRKQRHGGGVP